VCVCVCVCARVGYLLHSSNSVWFGTEKPHQHTFQIPRSRDFILFKMQFTQVFQILVCSCPKFIQFFEGYCVWMVLIWCYAQVAHCHRPGDVTTEGKGGKHTRVAGKQARKACEVFRISPCYLRRSRICGCISIDHQIRIYGYISIDQQELTRHMTDKRTSWNRSGSKQMGFQLLTFVRRCRFYMSARWLKPSAPAPGTVCREHQRRELPNPRHHRPPRRICLSACRDCPPAHTGQGVRSGLSTSIGLEYLPSVPKAIY